MRTVSTSETKLRLAPLQCVNCNAPLVVVAAPSLVCRFCGTSNVMPQIYRDELRLARNFIVPALVTVIFVAIQIIVLRAKR